MAIDNSTSVYVPGTLKESFNSPHGIHLPGNLNELRPETSKIIASALEYTKPSSSIIDISYILNASLAAQYPNARHVTSSYCPKLGSGLSVRGLSRAFCIVRTYIDKAKYVDIQEGTSSSTEYHVTTIWQLQIRRNSLEKTINIRIKTTEHYTPSIHDLQSEIIQSRQDPNLEQLHPTFGIHQKVSKRTVRFLKEEEDTAPLRLARLLFSLADEQSPCKRIVRVGIDINISTNNTANPSKHSVQVFGFTSIDRARYEQSQNSKLTEMLPNGSHRAYVALGSNVGDRIGNIESACQRMHDRGIKVTRTSALYETKAMYLEDQQSFINGACEVNCAHSATSLY